MAREFARVGVVGLGTMGAGIAEVFARNGLQVVAFEPDADGLDRGRAHLEQSTGTGGRSAASSPTTAQAALLGLVTLHQRPGRLRRLRARGRGRARSTSTSSARSSRRSTRIVKPDAVLATNTSSLSVTEISVATHNPRRVVGMHFFNPAPVLKFVEVIRTVVTEDDVVDDVKALAARIGKMPVVVGDKAGFIANALLFGYLNHAVSMYESRYASREDIDAAMTLGCGLPMGPLALMDLIGLDTAYEILDTMYKQGRDRLHAPTPDPQADGHAGLKGRKSGRGFYTYAEPGSSQVVPDAATPDDAASAPAWRSARSRRSGVVGSGTMATGIVEVFAKAGFDVVVVARSAEKVAAVQAARSARAWRRRSDAASSSRPTPRRRAGAGAAAPRRSTGPGRRRPGGRGGRRGPRRQAGAVRQPRRHLQAGRDPGDDDLVAARSSSARRRPSRPRDVVGMHFFNPAPVMKLVEVVSTVSTADDVVATVVDLCRRLGKHPVTLRRPVRVHRQRPAVPVPQRRGEDARGALRRRPTTSTPR